MKAVMEAQARSTAGTGTARSLRREGLVPAIIYGRKQESEMIAINAKSLAVEAKKQDFFNKLWDIKVDGQSRNVVAKDFQRHPVTDQLLHIDFMRVDADSKVTVSIPLRFINEDQSPALKRQALLNIIVHHLEIECPAASIPEGIEVDLSGVEMHHSILLASLNLPKGAKPKNAERDAVIATIVAPAGE